MPTVMTENIVEQTWRPRQKVKLPVMRPLPLENGARLSRVEFERRYEAMPRVKNAELIEGVVYMPSPIRNSHSEAHGDVMIWLGAYRIATPGIHLNDNATLRLDMDNELQPDVLLRLDSTCGGTSRISDDDYIEGPPELIVEVAASSVSQDLHVKKKVYRRNGVQEYIVWRVYDEALDWFQLQEGEYHHLVPGDNGIISSHVFPGLHLAVEALLSGDLSTVQAVVQEGTQTEEHIAFVERLAQMA